LALDKENQELRDSLARFEDSLDQKDSLLEKREIES
jgi:hypothetical protein